MKTIILAATFAAAVISVAAPIQAASQLPVLSLDQMLNSSIDRHGRGHGCDTPRDIAEHPRCTKA